jgi:hypothetical protein
MVSATVNRDQAARLLARATEAEDRGDKELAEMFTSLAMRHLDEAAASETTQSVPLTPPTAAEAKPVAQQQQQRQPKTADDKE